MMRSEAVTTNDKRRPWLVTGRRSHADLQNSNNGSGNIATSRKVFNGVESAAPRSQGCGDGPHL